MPRPVETLAQRLRLARTERALSQQDLAAQSGVKQPDVSKIERGEIQNPASIARLARALRVPTIWLEMGEGPEPDWTSAAVPPDEAIGPAGFDQAVRMTLGAVAKLNRLQAEMLCQAVKSLAEHPEMLGDACATLTPILEAARQKQPAAA